MKLRGGLCILGTSAGLFVEAMAGESGEYRWEQAGVRGGFSATSIEDEFYQTEAFARIELPPRLKLGENWRVRTGADFSAGMLARGDENALLATVGPLLTLGRDGIPVELVGGCSAALLSRDRFDEVNFGVPIQFISHLGLSLDLGRHVSLWYRFQHMSNASISHHNPGLNIHCFSLGVAF